MGNGSCLASLLVMLRILPFVLFGVVFIGYKLYYDYNPQAVKFFVLTDVHFDPAYNSSFNPSTRCRDPLSVDLMKLALLRGSHAVTPTPIPDTFVDSGLFGRPGCDAPLSLLQSTLHQMQIVNRNPDFIVITGDFVAHHETEASAVQRIINNVTSVVHSYFPNTPVFPAIGNNDVSPDYQVNLPPNSWFDFLADSWSVWLSADNQATMRQGGFYSADVAPKTKLLVLNTVFWSSYWANLTNDSPPIADPAGQFAWLEQQLDNARAAGDRVIIAGHIPPGQNQFDNIPSWHPDFVSRYLALVMSNNNIPVVAAQLYAHFHRDSFRVLYTDPVTQQQPVTSYLLAPAVTPLVGNNPAFRQMVLDKRRRILVDYTDYYMDLFRSNLIGRALWAPEYSFNAAYALPGASPSSTVIDAPNLSALVWRMRSDPVLFSLWVSRRSAMFLQARAEEDQYSTLCATTTATNEDYAACLRTGGVWPAPPPAQP